MMPRLFDIVPLEQTLEKTKVFETKYACSRSVSVSQALHSSSFRRFFMAALADFYAVSVDYLMGRTNTKIPYPEK